MTPETLTARGEAFHEALGRAYYEAGAGLTTDPKFQPVYERFADLQHDEALEAARRLGEPSIWEWAVDLRVGRAVAGLEERQMAWEAETVLSVDGREIPYLRAPIELQNTPDRTVRLALDRVRAKTGALGLAGLRRDRLTLEHDIACRLTGAGDYVAAASGLMGIGLDDLGAQCEVLLAETADLYRDALGRLAKRRLGVRVSELARADVGWLFRADAWDTAFPPDRMVAVAEGHMGDLGLDARRGGRVIFDTEERPAKQPRAFCVPVRVPDEVYLVTRPAGGHADYRTFWHELGHAMHFAAVPADAPFHVRWLGDNSVTEGFAMLWDHLTIEPGWLARYAPHDGLEDLVFELAVNELYMLRRYAAKLGYELWLHRSDLGHPGPAYAERLSAATLVRYPEEDALLDVDPGFYAARYLRAWQLEATWAQAFTERYDADWWRNPAAGSAIDELMMRGQADGADALARAVGRDLGFAPAVERLVRTLA